MRAPTRPELVGSFGMVSATHWLAAATGMSMLERGGNAFDAAVAAGLVLQVVEPHLNGPGGEVPVLIYDAAAKAVSVLCGQGPLPAAASVATLRRLGLRQVPGSGLLPACVPGAFGAWMALLEQHGRMDLEDVMGPAISYAASGFPLLPRAAASIAAQADHFVRNWPSSAEVYLPDGTVPRGGRLLKNPLLATTYQRVLDDACAAGGDREKRIRRAFQTFYEGFVAESIDRFLQSAEPLDDSGGRHRGLLTGEDLARWTPAVEEPVALDYAGMRVHKTGPWGQGPVFLQQLRLLDGFDVASADPASAEFVHLVVECAKLAFADREAYYGDPDHVEVPLDDLLSPAYAAQRRPLVGERASHELRPGAPGGRQARLPDPSLFDLGPQLGGPAGTPPDPIGRDTCHLDVVDREGNMVAATPSGGWLHGSPCVPGLGFSLSTRGQMCWLEDGLPASFVGGRRPRTTLSPTLALGAPDAALAFGTPGGDQQDQWTLAFFLRRVKFGMGLQEAIDLPAFHTTHFPSSFHPRLAHPGRLHVEGRLGQAALEELARRGHDVVVEGDWALGRICAVERHGQELRAGADPRQDQAYAVGR
ncbi:MAG: gamma-glutamyltransferase family protein [Acidimicrobiales bacterium]